MRKRPNPDSEPNIRRIDSKARASKQTHGFQVHFLRGEKMVSKMFSDTIYGGKEGARSAARKFKKSSMKGLPERVFRGPAAAKKTRSVKKSVKPKAKNKAKPKAAAKKSKKRRR
ncbi:MAG: hypothetical protein M3Y03_05265 [Verrucomicrobiota bacterium]|nr:hypothetical protein [Verrucomicrobiota bacterium]